MLEFWNAFKKKKYSYFVCYTAFFMLMAAVVLFRFVVYKKSIIWRRDGLMQHYNAILYYGKYLRQIAHTLITEHRFELPMWDFNIGYGSDIITSFHYYAIGDPLALLSGLVPERYCQYFFSFLYVLRLYLAGLSFSAFSFSKGNKRFPTMVGACIYVFSAYSLVLGLMHPFFVAPLIWFPLILLGIDRIFEQGKPCLFIVFTSIAAMSNFYFFYMEITLAVFYAIFRYFCTYKKFDIKSFAGILGKFMIYGLNAFMISALILLPMINVMMTSARLKAAEGNSVKLLYKWQFYIRFLAAFTNMYNPGSWTLLGYTAVGLLAVVFAFVRFKSFKRYLIVFMILTVFAIIPAGGFMLNGFAYVVNRWIWAYAMAVGMIAAKALGEFQDISFAERRKMAVALFVYCAIFGLLSVARSEQTMTSACILLACACIFMVVDVSAINKNVFRTAVVLLLMLGLTANAFYKQSYNHDDNDWLDEYWDYGVADRLLKEENSDKLVDGLGDDSFYRIEESGLDTTKNSSFQRGVHTTQYYHSITNGNISEFIEKMFMNCPKDYDYEGVESRSILEALASVKYFFVGEGAEADLPFNYNKKVAEGETPQGNVKVYTSDTALPIGYTYTEYVPESKFDEMNAVERADAMLSGAVLSDSTYNEATVSHNYVSDIESIEPLGGIEISDGQFYVRHDARVKVKLNAVDNAETYICFKNLKYRDIDVLDTYDAGEWANLTEYEKNLVKAESAEGGNTVTTSLMATCGDVSKIIEVYSPGADFYCGRSNFLVNLGYNKTAPDEITISFRNPGVYSFDSFEVISRPVDDIEDGLKKLAQDTLTDVEFGVNSVKGNISLDEKKILALSIPYSNGWTAYVDGQKADIKRCNIMYMALELGEGQHAIELRYETPMLRFGGALTLCGIFMLLMTLVAGKILADKKVAK